MHCQVVKKKHNGCPSPYGWNLYLEALFLSPFWLMSILEKTLLEGSQGVGGGAKSAQETVSSPNCELTNWPSAAGGPLSSFCSGYRGEKEKNCCNNVERLNKISDTWKIKKKIYFPEAGLKIKRHDFERKRKYSERILSVLRRKDSG